MANGIRLLCVALVLLFLVTTVTNGEKKNNQRNVKSKHENINDDASENQFLRIQIFDPSYSLGRFDNLDPNSRSVDLDSIRDKINNFLSTSTSTSTTIPPTTLLTTGTELPEETTEPTETEGPTEDTEPEETFPTETPEEETGGEEPDEGTDTETERAAEHNPDEDNDFRFNDSNESTGGEDVYGNNNGDLDENGNPRPRTRHDKDRKSHTGNLGRQNTPFDASNDFVNFNQKVVNNKEAENFYENYDDNFALDRRNSRLSLIGANRRKKDEEIRQLEQKQSRVIFKRELYEAIRKLEIEDKQALSHEGKRYVRSRNRGNKPVNRRRQIRIRQLRQYLRELRKKHLFPENGKREALQRHRRIAQHRYRRKKLKRFDQKPVARSRNRRRE